MAFLQGQELHFLNFFDGVAFYLLAFIQAKFFFPCAKIIGLQ